MQLLWGSPIAIESYISCDLPTESNNDRQTSTAVFECRILVSHVGMRRGLVSTFPSMVSAFPESGWLRRGAHVLPVFFGYACSRAPSEGPLLADQGLYRFLYFHSEFQRNREFGLAYSTSSSISEC